MDRFLTRSGSTGSLSSKRPGDSDIVNPGGWKMPKHFAQKSDLTPQPGVPTSNRFTSLNTERDPSSVSATLLQNATTTKKSNKIPPVFMEIKPEWTHEYIRTLISRYVSDYHLSYRNNFKVAIFCYSSESHKNIQDGLKSENISYHTFSRKDERNFKSVIFGLPAYAENTLIEELKALGFQGVSVHKLKITGGKEVPCPPFLVQLPPKTDMTSFRKIKYLCSCVVKIQKYRKNNFTGTQCYRCQSFGHSSKNCNLAPRCVKCTGPHLTQDCDKKDRSKAAQCCNCGGDHPANYRLCKERQKYLKLMETKKQELRTTQSFKRPTFAESRSWAEVAANKQDSRNAPNAASHAAARITQDQTLSQPVPFQQDATCEHDDTTAEMLKILMTIKSLKGQFQSCRTMIDKVLLILSHLGQYV